MNKIKRFFIGVNIVIHWFFSEVIRGYITFTKEKVKPLFKDFRTEVQGAIDMEINFRKTHKYK